MRRQAQVITEERAENLEQVKKLTKHVHEYVRGADASLSSAGDVAGVFSAAALGCRARLRDACERLILAQPGAQARRIEELLWRKVYYDPLTAAKKMRKGGSNGWNTSEGWMVSNHLSDGLAYYHHLMHQVHTNSHTIAAPGTIADFLPLAPLDETKDAVGGEVNYESYHRCLTCLGDLARYMLDLPSPPPYTLPARYYLQALHYQGEAGLTHSNLATVYSASHQPLLAAAHYLRALTCEKTFEGAEGNLKRILDKSRNWFEIQREELENNSKGSQQQQQQGTILLHASLTLVSYLFNNRDITEITHLCQEVLMKLGQVLEGTDDGDPDLSERSSTPTEDTAAATIQNGTSALSNQEVVSTDDNKNQDNKNQEKKMPFLMTPNAMVTICVVLIICTKRLRKQGSPHSSLSQALLVSVLLTVVTHVVEHIQQRISLVDPAFLACLLPEPEKSDDMEASKNGESSNTNTGEKENEEEKENIEGNKKKKKLGRIGRLASIRRKRRGSVDNSGESDEDGSSSDESVTDEEDPEDDNDASSSDGEEEEEELDMSQLCSSEDDDLDDSDEDVKIESDQEWDGLTAQEHLELIGQEGMMSPVYLLCVWLSREDDVIKMCGKMGGSMWKAVAKLLNLLRVNLEQLKEGPNIIRSEVVYLFQEGQKDQNEAKGDALDHTPLQEDLMLHTLIPSFQYGTDQQVLNLKSQELVLLRLHRLQMFGKKMALRKDTPLWYELETNTYKVSSKVIVSDESSKEVALQNDQASHDDQALQNVNPQDSSTQSKASPETENGPSADSNKESTNRLAGMHALTAQWLQHEVRSLEQRTARRATLGLYLVPDTHVLINHLQAIKTLLANPTHMIIIPQVVVDTLDQQKKESLGARDAIRWLEIKFRHGSRFIRAQRPHERTRLPLIKYPKRKDKEAWEWYQMVESCHYLSAQVHISGSGKSVKSSTVTLLTGKYHPKNSQDQPTTFNPSGVTQAAGAVLEHIEGFMAKWISSTKGHS